MPDGCLNPLFLARGRSSPRWWVVFSAVTGKLTCDWVLFPRCAETPPNSHISRFPNIRKTLSRRSLVLARQVGCWQRNTGTECTTLCGAPQPRKGRSIAAPVRTILDSWLKASWRGHAAPLSPLRCRREFAGAARHFIPDWQHPDAKATLVPDAPVLFLIPTLGRLSWSSPLPFKLCSKFN